jgi:hypothetical protein
LPPKLGKFLHKKECKFLVACGDDQHQEFLSVNSNGNPSKTKLGFFWTKFCQENNFSIGDTVRFKFAIEDPHKRCHIFKPTKTL